MMPISLLTAIKGIPMRVQVERIYQREIDIEHAVCFIGILL